MRSPVRACVFALLLLTAGLCVVGGLPAQTRAPKAEAELPASSFGAVGGHVYVAGSNAPARFVQIALQPVKIDLKEPPPGKQPVLAFTIYQTGLTGEYTIPHVAPGTYYVVTMQRGFFSPFSMFTKDELEHPSAEVQQRMAAVLPTVTVRANSTANLDVMLQRGASLSGAVRFDDGTPYGEANVSLEQHAADGKWVPLRVVESNTQTDSEGRWSIGGLPAGEYRVGVQLRVMERHKSSLLGDSMSFTYLGGYELPVWLGDTARERDAKSVKLADGEAAQAVDITVPVSKMHSVSGAVVDKATGQAVNSGEVTLRYAGDDKPAASVRIDPETRTFTLPYVFEGEYVLGSKDAHESRYEGAPLVDGVQDPTRIRLEAAVLRWYAPGEMPLVVQGDMSAVSLAVEAKAARVAQTP